MEGNLQHAFLAGAAAAHQRLTKLLKDYGSVETVHPAVTSLRRRSEADGRMLEQAMSGDYQLLLGRSSRLENFEINIFEAAFVRLMEDTKTHPGAMQIYVEELLGLKVVAQPLKPRALSGAVKVRTMFMNLAINDAQPQSSPTRSNPPFIFPQNESGMQLLSNLQSRAGYAPIRVPVQTTWSGYDSLVNNNAHSNKVQPRNTFSRSIFPYTMKENDLPCLDNNRGDTSTAEMDDPKLTSLLAEYHKNRHIFKMGTANNAGYQMLDNGLRDAAQRCIHYMSQVKPGDARLGHPSPLLPESKEKTPDSAINGHLSPAESALLRSLSHNLGQKHRSIAAEASDVVANHPSTVCRAVCASILSKHLARFQQKILEVEKSILDEDSSIVGAYNIVPLSSIVAAFDGWERRLAWLLKLVSSIRIDASAGGTGGSNAQRIHTSSGVIGYLRDATHTGYPDIEEIALDLVKVAETAWLKQLVSWLLYGKLPSLGAVDFFISRVTQKSEDNETKDAFVVRPELVPPLVEPDTANSILFIGKSLSYLRTRWTAGGEGNDLDNSLAMSEIHNRHLSQLSLLAFPISASRFTTSIRSVRLSLSKNVLQKLLPLPQVLNMLRLLKDFFLLERGEFALALISAADERLAEKQKNAMDKSSLKGPESLKHIMIKEGEISSILPRVWSTMASFQNLDDEDGDQDLDLARELIQLSLESKARHLKTSREGQGLSNLPDKFQDILLPTATVLTLRLEPPLELFLSLTEVNAYTRIHAYLLAIRRAHLHLSQLMTLSALRRDPRPSPGSSASERFQAQGRQAHWKSERFKKLRAVWATVGSATFLLAELGAYFQSEVIQSSWAELQAWLDPAAATSSRPQPQEDEGLSTGLREIELPPQKHPAEATPAHGVAMQSKEALRDPERLMMAHQNFLDFLCQSLLLDRGSFTDRLRALMADVDHLCALMNRLHIIQQSVDLEKQLHPTGTYFNSGPEEARLVDDLASARRKIDACLTSLVGLLRDIDATRAAGSSAYGLKRRKVDEEFVPKMSNRLDRLLLKLDNTSPQTRASQSNDADAFGWSE
ncbi:MAG: hypothetical protein L6R35_000387 [Caloplaca aegaea]|nr:MAG: hypothetical protein L6R35_000387 [Caloplaca aegaea]